MDRTSPTRPYRVRGRPFSAIFALSAVLVVAVAAIAFAGGSSGPSSAGDRIGHPARVDAALTGSAGDVSATSTHLIVASAGDTATGGYWLAASNGGIFAFGAPFEGSAGALALDRPVVGMTPTASDLGYWLVASDGGIFTYGDAAYQGSMGGQHLDQPIVGMAATPDGGGYWLVASDGGIFAFGDAAFHGSMGGQHLDQPIVGMAATPDGGGYWLVASDGGIFAFGDATFAGSMGGQHLDQPIVGMQSASGGYRLVAADGGLFSYGTPFAGAAVGLLQRRAVSIDSSGTGYRIVSADGSVYAFGGASYVGSVTVPPLVGEVVTIDPGHAGVHRRAHRRRRVHRAVRHRRHDDRVGLYRARLQLRHGPATGGPSPSRWCDGGTHPLHGHRRRTVCQRPCRHRQRRRFRCCDIHPRRRWPGVRSGLHRRRPPPGGQLDQ